MRLNTCIGVPLHHTPHPHPLPAPNFFFFFCLDRTIVLCFGRRLLTYKPQGSKVTLDIMSADVECLDPGEYLNDKIIDFYLK